MSQQTVNELCSSIGHRPFQKSTSKDFFEKSGCQSKSLYDMYKTLSPEFFQQIMSGAQRCSPPAKKSLIMTRSPKPSYELTELRECSKAAPTSDNGQRRASKTLSNGAKQNLQKPDGTVAISASVLRKLRSSLSEVESSDFLIKVKEQVAVLKRETESLAAADIAEKQYDMGAVLSCVDLSSSEHCSSHSSIKSNAATVIGRISPEKAHEYLKLQLKNEGHSASTIAYELSAHMSPKQMRLQQRRRRLRHNQMRIKRFPERFRNRANDRGSEERMTTSAMQERRLSADEQWTPQEASSKVIGSPLSCTTTTEFGEVLEPCNNCWSEKEQTHDEKIVAYLRQRLITRKFTHLQKLRDRGELSLLGFEKAKREILFLEVFEYDDVKGNIKIRKTSLDSLEKAFTKKRLFSQNCGGDILYNNGLLQTYLNRCKRQKCGGVKEKELSHLDDEEIFRSFMSYNLNETTVQNELIATHSSDDEDTTTHVEIYKDDDISVHSKEQDRIACRLILAQRVQKQMLKIWSESSREHRKRSEMKLRNFERREMLMRRFDQRAPPEARMFQQDTTFDKVSKKQQNDWSIWRSSKTSLPEWMHGNKTCRQIIFPQDKKKL